MEKQNNTPEYLKLLWRYEIIDTKQYFFRLKANKLGINTYKLII